MGVRILHEGTDNQRLYCSTSDTEFGLPFTKYENVESFLGWLKEDARNFTEDDLALKITEWRDSKCDTCDGEGTLEGSDCCGAAPRSNGDCDTSDFGICPDCHDHCEYDIECFDCNGKGVIDEL